MAVNDTVADMISRMRNSLRSHSKTVVILPNKVTAGIARVLVEEGFIESVEESGEKGSRRLKLQLKYGPSGEEILREVKRVSLPSRRVYVKAAEVPVVNNGLGIAILSTPKGIMSSVRARKGKLGGELLCTVI